MSEQKFTPGPWAVGYGRGVTGPGAAWQFGLSASTDVLREEAQAKTTIVSAPKAFTGAGGVIALTCDEANARLIAAAPDLLEALGCLLPVMRLADSRWAQTEEFRAAESAIKKALGDE